MAIGSLVLDLLLVALPSGGQRTARRNAWAGVVEDAARGRATREAQAALLSADAAARLRREQPATGT